jgi:predicted ATPase/DNA-binding SARP family transcriptional activator
MAALNDAVSKNDLWFAVLGPLQVSRGGRPLSLGGPKPRALLAALLVQPGRLVPTGNLVETLWGERPPSTATKTLQKYLSVLRQQLGPVLASSPGGYLLAVEDDQLDSRRFEILLSAAKSADAESALDSYEEALALWRGDPFPELVDSEVALAERAGLIEQRLAATEALAEIELNLGRLDRLVGRLEQQVTLHPLRERLWELLMLALYRTGRQADALRTYQRIRRLLAEELGIDPSPELQRLESRILSQDPDLDAEPAPISVPRSEIHSFLFCDLEGSTELLQRLGAESYRTIHIGYHALVVRITNNLDGEVLNQAGDGVFTVFPTASQAVAAAAEIIFGLAAQTWPEGVAVRPRIGIHTGEAQRPQGGELISAEIHRAARVAQSAWGGQVVISETAWELAREGLAAPFAARDLGRHHLRSFTRPLRLFQLLHPQLEDSFPPLRTEAEAANNLPVQLTSFIGRVEELGSIEKLLGETRLLTLVGPGGSGKTRLALESGARALSRFPQGVWMVDLAPLTSPDHVAMAVARPLGISGQPGRPPESVLIDYLADQELLLIIDNCEHLVSKVAQLAATLLKAAPGLRILATSRETLGIMGESTFDVQPLACPDPSGADDLETFDAVRLFLDRAQAAAPRLSLGNEEMQAVAHIACRLDGMPLALELAAALVRAYPPLDLAGLLDDRFDLLASTDPSRPARHQTLRAAVSYSYDLLSAAAQELFPRLSLFRGGFDLEAVRKVCAFQPLDPSTVHRVLRELVDKSLVTLSEGSDRTRYRLLETLREFGQERLSPPESRENRQRHAVHFGAVAHQAGTETRGPQQGLWFRRLSANTDNLRKALRWLFDQEPVAGVRMAVSLADHWDAVGPLVEAHEWLQRAVELSNQGGPELEISARLAAGDLFVSSHSSRSRHYAEEALAIARQAGDELAQGRAMRVLGWSMGLVGDYEEGRQYTEESYAILQRLGGPWEQAWSLERLGQIEYRDPARSIDIYQKSLALYRQAGDRRRASLILYKMADRTLQTPHRLDLAESWVRESLAVFSELGCTHDYAHALLVLGRVLRRMGRLPEAREALEEALDHHLRLGDQRCAARSSGALGVVLTESGEAQLAIPLLERSLRFGIDEPLQILVSFYSLAGLYATDSPRPAAVLFGVAEELNDQVRITLSENAALNRSGFITAARNALGEEDFEQAMAEGRAMGVEAAIVHALRMIERQAEPTPLATLR